MLVHAWASCLGYEVQGADVRILKVPVARHRLLTG